jgi:cell pole-organizing protein PopZ
MAAERAGSPGVGSAPGASADPSMEDILASIRRILSEDEAGPASPAPGEDAESAKEARPAAAMPAAEPLELTDDMLVSAPEPATPPAAAAQPDPASPPAPETAPDPAPDMALESDRSLLAPAAAAAAAASVGTLLRAVAADRASPVTRGGPSIEDVVREELRPLLKEWLDQHLPPLVERLVRAEIERVVSRALS